MSGTTQEQAFSRDHGVPKVLIVGASGFVGTAIARAAMGNPDIEPIACMRRPSRQLNTSCRGLSAGIGAAGAVLRYVRETQPTASLAHLRRIHVCWNDDAMHLDSATIRNLELVRPLESGEHRSSQDQPTVLSVLDRTTTAMGSRLLRQWLVRPLLDCDTIHARLDAVGELKDLIQQRVSLRSALRNVQDMARLGSRVTLGIEDRANYLH